jgi:tetratricopeptide (TPR) repeat protein
METADSLGPWHITASMPGFTELNTTQQAELYEILKDWRQGVGTMQWDTELIHDNAPSLIAFSHKLPRTPWEVLLIIRRTGNLELEKHATDVLGAINQYIAELSKQHQELIAAFPGPTAKYDEGVRLMVAAEAAVDSQRRRHGYADAVIFLRGSLAEGSLQARTHNALGSALRHADADYDGAEAAHRAAIACNPQFSNAHWNLGALLMNHRMDFPAAEAAYRAAIACEPNYADAHFSLGVLLQKRTSPLVEIHFRQVIHKDPNQEAAIVAYQAAVACDQKFSEYRQYYQGKPTCRYKFIRGEAAFKEAVSLVAASPPVAKSSADIADMYRAAISCDPAFSEYMDSYGRVHCGRYLTAPRYFYLGSNADLITFGREIPPSLSQMLLINGMGKLKLENYGEVPGHVENYLAELSRRNQANTTYGYGQVTQWGAWETTEPGRRIKKLTTNGGAFDRITCYQEGGEGGYGGCLLPVVNDATYTIVGCRYTGRIEIAEVPGAFCIDVMRRPESTSEKHWSVLYQQSESQSYQLVPEQQVGDAADDIAVLEECLKECEIRWLRDSVMYRGLADIDQLINFRHCGGFHHCELRETSLTEIAVTSSMAASWAHADLKYSARSLDSCYALLGGTTGDYRRSSLSARGQCPASTISALPQHLLKCIVAFVRAPVVRILYVSYNTESG